MFNAFLDQYITRTAGLGMSGHRIEGSIGCMVEAHGENGVVFRLRDET